MKTRYDSGATGHHFKEGDRVWMYNPKRRRCLSPKLQQNWEGHYTIVKKLNDVIYRVQRLPNPKPKVPNGPVVDAISFSEYEIYQPYLTPISEMIWVCHLKFDVLNPTTVSHCIPNHRNIRCTKEDHNILRTCYTIHTLLDRPDAEEQQVSTQETELLMIDAGSALWNVRVAEPQLYMSIHNSKNILNPYVYGYILEKGKINVFRLTKTVKHLLPPPYETKCKDYLSEWKNRGGRGPTDERVRMEQIFTAFFRCRSRKKAPNVSHSQ
ncbi:hypothetical protein AVEN_113456-1 [Araneus ventricosus]|uniref:Integrase p58-like C-terminal domain-containing protein n=1 Tax=Araneus ventricosus TaxID=182803 RepID=A0A4Y2LU56_ARAVE|nr:hypothetical protein AVEN_113456-1 [Araneus ventricosus]